MRKKEKFLVPEKNCNHVTIVRDYTLVMRDLRQRGVNEGRKKCDTGGQKMYPMGYVRLLKAAEGETNYGKCKNIFSGQTTTRP